jgi:hypothetical protein
MATIYGQSAGGVSVTPNDSTDLTRNARGVYCTAAGTLKVTMANGDVLTFTSVACQYHPIEVKRIWSTGTTATGIIALYHD